MTPWIAVMVSIIVITTAIAILIVVLWDNKRSENNPALYRYSTWSVELWNISQGFRVNLLFQSNSILGRNNLYSAITSYSSPEIDNTISREHCMLYEQDGMIWVWNLSAVNPATINGIRLNNPQPLIPGHRLGLGTSTFLVTRVDRLS